MRREPALEWLVHARLERVDRPRRELYSLSFGRDEGVLLLSLAPSARAVGLASDRPRGDPADATTRRLRNALSGARLVAAEQWIGSDETAVALVLHFARASSAAKLAIDFDARAPAVFLLDPVDDRVTARIAGARTSLRVGDAFAPGIDRKGIAPVSSASELERAARTLLEAATSKTHSDAHADLRERAKRALARVLRRITAIEGDLARVATAASLRDDASALLCLPRTTARGPCTLEVTRPSDDTTARIDLLPGETAVQAAERLFSKARRWERGLSIAERRRAEALAERDALKALLLALDAPESTEAMLESLADAARLSTSGGPSAPTRAKATRGERVPFRVFRGHNGAIVLVGKGAKDNDALTLRHARPQDLFVHVRGGPGAHVIVPLERNAEPSSELLVDAAHLAAHFSGERGEAVVDVTYAPRRYVRKPKGAAVGAVLLDREKVLTLRVDPAILRRLLASEESREQ